MSDEQTTATDEQSAETDAENDAQIDAEQSEADEQGDRTADDAGETQDTEQETFPRSYVEELRAENQRYRERGKRADELSRRLHTELVRATGRLADPTDLPFDEAHLDDTTALAAAIDDLLTRKPHMAARRPTGDIGQGATPSHTPVDLAGILRARAG